MTVPREIIERSLKDCAERIEKAQETIDRIRDGWRFFEAQGDEDMRDVTDQRLAKQEQIQRQARDIAAAYEAHLGGAG